MNKQASVFKIRCILGFNGSSHHESDEDKDQLINDSFIIRSFLASNYNINNTILYCIVIVKYIKIRLAYELVLKKHSLVINKM